MMPKEKAKVLVEKFWIEVDDNDYPIRKMSFKQAKQCASFAVDEIINTYQVSGGIDYDEKQFWEQVKNEINNI